MVLVGLLVIGVKPHISTKVKTQKGWILKISYQNYSLFYFLFNIYIDNASSAEPWMDKWSHGIILECITPPTPKDKKSNLSRRKCGSMECSFDEINNCKNECPKEDGPCLLSCFKDECTFGKFCKCSSKQMKNCEKKCKNKKCKKNAFCLESCINATC